MDYTYILSESFENDIKTRLTERQRLTEDTVGSLAVALNKFFDEHADVVKALAGKLTIDNWNAFSKEVSADFSRFLTNRFNIEKKDGFKGMLDKLLGQTTDLGNSAQSVWKQLCDTVVKNPDKYKMLHIVMNAKSSSGRYTMGKDLIIKMINMYLNGNETRGGIATGASRTAHKI